MSDTCEYTGNDAHNDVRNDALYCVRYCSINANCINCNILRENINDGRVLCLSFQCPLTYDVLTIKQCICVYSCKDIAIDTLKNYINHNFNNDIIKGVNPESVMYSYRNK